jgi:hypothetical protein
MILGYYYGVLGTNAGEYSYGVAPATLVVSVEYR